MIGKNAESKPLVLVAEDDYSSYLLVSTLLTKYLLQPIRASNGIEAVEMVKTNPEIKLVLMDMRMPEMDGIEAARLIKSFKPDLPVIFLTAHEMDENQEVIKDICCDDYLIKPFNRELLRTKLEKFIL
ncbi:MAG TPA: response regulator [Bacteroidales bacterium]|nr:response regulator [Bacteroidales bacterium]